ncbi:MAG: hypothetical protein PWQ55_2375 [Chloroflexota bacterium]|nr:hypothetical protein [Chloroflexota bacterium]
MYEKKRSGGHFWDSQQSYNGDMPDINQSFTQRVAHTYNNLSGSYDLLSGKAEQRLTRTALDYFDPQPGSRLLDLGCGTGNALLAMQRTFPAPVSVAGLDIAFGMCRVAHGKLQRAEGGPSGAVYCANALQTPFPGGLFDGILLSFTLELFPRELFSPLLAECRRLLKPQGKLALVSMACAQKASWIYNLYLWAHRKYPRWIDCRPIDSAAILRENGFRIIKQKTHDLFGLPVETTLAS